MTSNLLHPALSQLLRYQASARLRRIYRTFSTRRKLLLSCLGLLLAVIWLGNVILTIFFRESSDPATLRGIIPAALLLYSLWHVVRFAYRRPEEGIEWTPAERELLCARPFGRRDLLLYRLVPIFMSAMLKAVCFALLTLPDLRLPLAGLIGALLALLFVDFFRMAAQIIAAGVSRFTYRCLRIAVLAPLSIVGIAVLVGAFRSPAPLDAGKYPGLLGLLMRVLESAARLRETWTGKILELPFQGFTNVITAEQYSPGLAGWIALAAAMLAAAAWLVMRIDAYFFKAIPRRERMEYRRLKSAAGPARTAGAARTGLPRIRWCGGIGPIAWRQVIGATTHWGGLLLALATPYVLACLPLIVFDDPNRVLLNVVGSLGFYSFVLLPTALKFDFRRDVDQIAILKSLPIRPAAVVTGQLAVPILIASIYQLAVLLTAELVYPVNFGLTVAAFVLLAPLNILIFALDNLIYLLYPYRPNQEGLEVFLRTTLTFTAKAILFTLAVGITFAWTMASVKIASVFAGSNPLLGNVRIVFVIGAWCMLCLSAAATWWLLVGAYRRFDPSQDAPA